MSDYFIKVFLVIRNRTYILIINQHISLLYLIMRWHFVNHCFFQVINFNCLIKWCSSLIDIQLIKLLNFKIHILNGEHDCMPALLISFAVTRINSIIMFFLHFLSKFYINTKLYFNECICDPNSLTS